MIVNFVLKTYNKFLCSVVHLTRLNACTTNNKWHSCFINQDVVHFIDNSKVVATLNTLVWCLCHVVSKIVKAKFVVRCVSYVCPISFLAFVERHTAINITNRKPQKFVNLAHPLTVTPRQIFVDSNHMHTVARKCIKVCWQC